MTSDRSERDSLQLSCVSCGGSYTLTRTAFFDMDMDQKRRCPECNGGDGPVTCPGCKSKHHVSRDVRQFGPIGWRFCQTCKDAGKAPYIKNGVYHEPILTKPAPLPAFTGGAYE